MKPSISKKTKEYLDSLENKAPEQSDYYYGQMDTIDKLIYEDGLRIKALHFHPDLNLMLIILNNGKVLQRTLSYSERLVKATEKQLNRYEFIGKGTGIHWPDIDEDLSLRGFLQEELSQIAKPLDVAS